MKSLTAMTAAALLVAGMSFATAQTTANPGTINAGTSADGQTKNSGTQTANPSVKTGTQTSQQGGASGATSPADINARPSDNGTLKSGSESKAAATQSNGKAGVAPSTTTGAAAKSPADPNAKPGVNGKN